VPRPDRGRDRHGLRLGAHGKHGLRPRQNGESTEVYFADTHDTIGPLGAKAQGEGAINPIAPAIANALADATGVRFAHLPFTPDRIFGKLSGQP
jgi:CO/xanthine dehydrogenase Mo-binding subunit